MTEFMDGPLKMHILVVVDQKNTFQNTSTAVATYSTCPQELVRKLLLKSDVLEMFDKSLDICLKHVFMSSLSHCADLCCVRASHVLRAQ